MTADVVTDFVFAAGTNLTSNQPRSRLTAVRGFARYLAAQDSRHEIPPADLASYRPSRHQPYLYSDDEVTSLVRWARACARFSFQGHTQATLIGLLAVTGMRVSEAISLERDDIDSDQAVLHVRDSKFRKGRDLPISGSTLDVLAGYARARDARSSASTRLFVSMRGTPVIYACFQRTFRRVVTTAGIAPGRVPAPRVHDLRHRFATQTLLGWHRDGVDVEALLPCLSTYLGHSDPRFTYHYLTATPELLDCAAARLEHAQAVTR